jgi:hypothetical protein
MSERTAVYRLFDADGALLYVGISKSFGLRWQQHAHAQPWWPEVQRQTVEWRETRREAEEAETVAILSEKPRYNRDKAVPPPPLSGAGRIGIDLATAQSEWDDGRAELQKDREYAVAAALGAGWSKYKIAQAMGVKGSTVDSIVNHRSHG